VVPHFKPYDPVFYFNFLELGKASFRAKESHLSLDSECPDFIFWIQNVQILFWVGPTCQFQIPLLPLSPACQPTPRVSLDRPQQPTLPDSRAHLLAVLQSDPCASRLPSPGPTWQPQQHCLGPPFSPSFKTLSCTLIYRTCICLNAPILFFRAPRYEFLSTRHCRRLVLVGASSLHDSSATTKP
jgi:hypothetical protein